MFTWLKRKWNEFISLFVQEAPEEELVAIAPADNSSGTPVVDAVPVDDKQQIRNRCQRCVHNGTCKAMHAPYKVEPSVGAKQGYTPRTGSTVNRNTYVKNDTDIDDVVDLARIFSTDDVVSTSAYTTPTYTTPTYTTPTYTTPTYSKPRTSDTSYDTQKTHTYGYTPSVDYTPSHSHSYDYTPTSTTTDYTSTDTYTSTSTSFDSGSFSSD